MSNIFKSNTRFSSLIDDIPLKKNKEPKKSFETSRGEEFNSFKTDRIRRKETHFGVENEREDKKYLEEKVNLSLEHFPELVSNSDKKSIENTNLGYIEKLKKLDSDVEISVDPDLEYLKPGWVLLKRDPFTRRTIIKHHPETIVEEKEKEKTEKEIAMDILNVLVESYTKRTQDYIQNYGYEEWERMFKFPNWKEEETYLERMDEMMDMSEDEHVDDDYDTNYEYDEYDYDNIDDF